MAAPSKVLAYGSNALQLSERPRIRRTSEGLDEGEFLFTGGLGEFALALGSTVPGYSGMIIRDIASTLDAGDYEHAVTARGFRDGGTYRVIGFETEQTEEGFDTGTLNIIALRGAFPVQRGNRGSLLGQGNLVCTSLKEGRHSDNYFKTITAGFRGIVGSKPGKIYSGTLGREISRENFSLNLPGGVYNTPLNWSMLWGRPFIQHSYLDTASPDFGAVPSQGGSPPLSMRVAQFNLTGSVSDYTFNWPNGWTLVGREGEQIPGASIWLVKDNWVYNHRVTP